MYCSRSVSFVSELLAAGAFGQPYRVESNPRPGFVVLSGSFVLRSFNFQERTFSVPFSLSCRKAVTTQGTARDSRFRRPHRRNP
jgi:hypothetical protein